MRWTQQQYVEYLERLAKRRQNRQPEDSATGALPELQKCKAGNPGQQGWAIPDTNRPKNKKENGSDYPSFAVSICFLMADRRVRDLTGMAETVMDCLVDAGVLPDDRWTVVPELRLSAKLSNEIAIEIEVERIE